MSTQNMGTGPIGRTTQILPGDGGTSIMYVQQPKNWGRRFMTAALVLVLCGGAYFGLKAVNLWPTLRNPFVTQTTDRTGPVLLKSMQDLSRYVAAEGNFQVLVDLQENKRFIPSFIFSERTLFIGVGTVDAYVDFSTLTEGAIKVSADGKSVEITLPEPVLDKPSIDNDRSYVYSSDRGIINRIGDLIGGDPNKQQQLYQLAELKITQAAQESELKARAEENTRTMLETMLKGLGYENVTVKFVPAAKP